MNRLLACVILGTSSTVWAAPPSSTLPSQPASPPASAYAQPHIGIEASVGLGTPLGFGGATLILAPHRSLSLELGAGLSLHEQHRQTSALVRVAPWPTRTAVSFAAGLSRGEYTWYYSNGIIGQSRKDWDDARWINLEVSTDLPFHSMKLRFFGGFGSQLDADSGCVEQAWTNHSGLPAEDPNRRPCSGRGGTWLVYTGVALRFATPLGL